MPRFVGTFTNKIDAKGRVSVPAGFRAAAAGPGGFNGVSLYPAFTDAALEGGGRDLLDDVEAALDRLKLYGEEREAFEIAVLGEARELNFDADGRVTLPAEFLDHATLNGQATFVGRGRRFQIWAPEVYADKRAAARDKARELRELLDSPHARGNGREAAE
ncbi:MAG: division/cell wall cluster transcriptional repressor MraZ [Pseudomonadota bacterium]